jgi:hypothetical protein
MDTSKFDIIVGNLKILSNIPRNGKICRSSNGGITIEADSLLQPLKRILYRDSRTQAITDITSITNETFSLLKLLLSSCAKSRELAQNTQQLTKKEADLKTIEYQVNMLSKEFTSCITGLENLKTTYNTDIKVKSQLDVILDKIEFYSLEIKEFCGEKDNLSEEFTI